MEYIFGPADYEQRRGGLDHHHQSILQGNKHFAFELVQGGLEEEQDEEECNLFSFNSPRQYLSRKSYPVKQQQVFSSSPAQIVRKCTKIDTPTVVVIPSIETSHPPPATQNKNLHEDSCKHQDAHNNIVPILKKKSSTSSCPSSSLAIVITFHDIVEIFTFCLNEDDDELDVDLVSKTQTYERIKFENTNKIITSSSAQNIDAILAEWSLINVKPSSPVIIVPSTSPREELNVIKPPPLLWWMWDYKGFLSWTCQVAE